eukprot:756327_1
MNEDSYNDDDQKYNDRQPSEVEIDDQDKSWAELQAQLYSEEAEKVADNMWKQLRCKTTTMTYTVTWVKCIYIMIAVICIPIGVITFNLSSSVIMQEFPAYSSISGCSLPDHTQNTSWGKQCTINYTLDYDFTPPIYFHYKLTNFYQNHRSYAKSRSERQLQNDDVLDVDNCDPDDVKNSEINSYKMLPCGLIANSFFNDKYKVKYIELSNDNTPPKIIDFCNTTQCDKNEQDENMKWSDASWYAYPNWDNSNIAWESDINGKFEETKQIADKTTDINKLQHWQHITLPDTEDPDFIVWMRTSTISTFTKLHRIINKQKLKKGSILQVTIKNYFGVSTFKGE